MKFYDYLNKIRPIINASALERLAGIPTKSLGKHYSWVDTGKGNAISQDHSPAIVRAVALVNGGVVKIDRAIVYVEHENQTFTVVNSNKLTIDEVALGVFEYTEKQSREEYTDFDFCHCFWQML